MSDEVLTGKTAMIDHCVRRAREEYEKDPTTFFGDITRRDAATLNVIRAWEAAVEMGDYVIGAHDLGTPEDERGVFMLLRDRGWIPPALAEGLKRTGEFCRAEWDYQAAPLPALVTIVKRDLSDLEVFARALVDGDAARSNAAPVP